jgi:hypothetical protein
MCDVICCQTRLAPGNRQAPVRNVSSVYILLTGDPIDQEDQADSDSFFDIETGKRLPIISTTPKSILKKNGAVDSPSNTSPPE